MLHQTRTLYAFETAAFESVEGMSLSLEEPTPDPANPIVPTGAAGEPDDRRLCYTASIGPWGGGHGMWYQAQDARRRLTRCFASSTDGWAWRKHGVIGEGLFNTIGNGFNVWHDGDRYLAPLTSLGHDPSVAEAYAALRPADVPDPRRRLAVEKQIARSGRAGVPTFIGVANSDDGLRWSMPRPLPRIPMMLEAPRLYRFGGRYIMNAQTHGAWFDPPVKGPRRVALFTSDDLVHWQPHPQPVANTAHESIGGQTHVGVVPIKRIDDRLLIGLGGRFDDGDELTDQHFDVTLLFSTDGLAWNPLVPGHERRNWVRRGRPGEWDFGGVAGIGLVERGDEAAVYYSGTAVGNGSHAFPSYDPGPCQVGRVRLGRDRFAALQPRVGWKAIFESARADAAAGSLTTHPLTLDPRRPVSLNIQMPRGASRAVASVELLRPDATPCDRAEVTTGGIAVPVPFQHPPPREPVRLRITLTGEAAPDRVPRLFAIEY